MGRRPNHERYYKQADEELQQGSPQQGLWAQCLLDSAQDEPAAEELYIKRRANQLHRARGEQAVDIAVTAAIQADAERDRIKQERWRRVEGAELNQEEDTLQWRQWLVVGVALIGLAVVAAMLLRG